MAWLELTIAMQAQDPAALEESLLEVGAQAITLSDGGDQPLLEPGVGETPLWQDVTLSALFDTGVDVGLVESRARAACSDSTELIWRRLEDRAWEREWLERLEPRQFGRRLWVVPGDMQAPDADAVVVKLDPGLAFGTGDHATTALCLAWLDDQQPDGLQVLDYGCGSGILAIAALKLGAARARCIDIDPQALQATRDNAARNALSDRVDVGIALAADEAPFDLIVANILAGPLCTLAETLSTALRSNGAIALSGILAEQTDDVRKAYDACIDWQYERQLGDWAIVAGLRRERS